jgi:hypothetical protein
MTPFASSGKSGIQDSVADDSVITSSETTGGGDGIPGTEGEAKCKVKRDSSLLRIGHAEQVRC